ncbi:LON peptidase substrate-binding domain-containing protein, partial [bacterium]|nr:LON peptidase substrate-binding domain-containing protein [bacterium]
MSDTTNRAFSFSEPIPVLPVRNTVLFPNTISPLVVGRAKSIEAVRRAQKAGDLLLVVAQKQGERNDPNPAELHSIGVVCLVSKLVQAQPKTFQLVANTLFRFRITEIQEKDGCLMALGEQWPDLALPSRRAEVLAQEVKKLGLKLLSLVGAPGSDNLAKSLAELEAPEKICDLCCSFLTRSVTIKQAWLENRNLEDRLNLLLEELVGERERATLQNEIQARVLSRASKDQRDHFL